MDTPDDSQLLDSKRTNVASTVLPSASENFDQFALVWLDSNVDKTPDCIDTKMKLKQLIHFLSTFDDVDTCLEYVRSIYTERILFIVSGRLSKVVLPIIYSLQQILFIYIFCENKTEHEQWPEHYQRKLQGIFIDKDDLLQKLNNDLQILSTNSIPCSVFDFAKHESSIKDLNEDKVTFLWCNLLIETLLEVKYNNINAKSEMIRECRFYYNNNTAEMGKIDEFKNSYTANSAIKWYTRDSFIYRLINKALRTQNIDVIFKFRFFLKDLYNLLKNEHLLQFRNRDVQSFHVYRGQLMAPSELEKMKANINGYFSFNSFISTTLSSATAVEFCGSGFARPTFESIIFDMYIDVSHDDSQAKPFAIIGELSYMKHETEILFAIGSVFQIQSVDEFDDIWYVQLRLSKQIDENIQTLLDYYKGMLQNDPDSNLSSLAELLVEMGEYNTAEKYYNILLAELSVDCEISDEDRQHDLSGIHAAIGDIYFEKGDEDEAMKKYEFALSITPTSNAVDLSTIYSSMGIIHRKRGDIDKALAIYEKALEFHLNLPISLTLACIHNNMGSLYQKKSNYEIALRYYDSSLSIKRQLLPSNHPNLSFMYNNIGTLHYVRNEFEKALECFKNALDIQLSSLPSSHVDLANTYSNIGAIHDENRNHAEALVYYHRAVDIYLANNISNHRHLSILYTNIAINEKICKNFSTAIIYYEGCSMGSQPKKTQSIQKSFFPS